MGGPIRGSECRLSVAERPFGRTRFGGSVSAFRHPAAPLSLPTRATTTTSKKPCVPGGRASGVEGRRRYGGGGGRVPFPQRGTSLRQTSGGHYWQLDQRPWQRGIHVEILFFFLFQFFKFFTVHYSESVKRSRGAEFGSASVKLPQESTDGRRSLCLRQTGDAGCSLAQKRRVRLVLDFRTDT